MDDLSIGVTTHYSYQMILYFALVEYAVVEHFRVPISLLEGTFPWPHPDRQRW